MMNGNTLVRLIVTHVQILYITLISSSKYMHVYIICITPVCM